MSESVREWLSRLVLLFSLVMTSRMQTRCTNLNYSAPLPPTPPNSLLYFLFSNFTTSLLFFHISLPHFLWNYFPFSFTFTFFPSSTSYFFIIFLFYSPILLLPLFPFYYLLSNPSRFPLPSPSFSSVPPPLSSTTFSFSSKMFSPPYFFSPHSFSFMSPVRPVYFRLPIFLYLVSPPHSHQPPRPFSLPLLFLALLFRLLFSRSLPQLYPPCPTLATSYLSSLSFFFPISPPPVHRHHYRRHHSPSVSTVQHFARSVCKQLCGNANSGRFLT